MRFVLVLNTKKSELAKLKHQLESYQNENSTTKNGNEPYIDSYSQSTTTLNDIKHSTNKRNRDHRSDTDTSEDEDIQEINISNRLATQSKLKVVDNNQNSSLDLGNDQMDYKTSTINKHYQRRKHITGVNTISTRPFVSHASGTSTMTTPSLPDDSQTTDDLLNKI